MAENPKGSLGSGNSILGNLNFMNTMLLCPPRLQLMFLMFHAPFQKLFTCPYLPSITLDYPHLFSLIPVHPHPPVTSLTSFGKSLKFLTTSISISQYSNNNSNHDVQWYVFWSRNIFGMKNYYRSWNPLSYEQLRSSKSFCIIII